MNARAEGKHEAVAPEQGLSYEVGALLRRALEGRSTELDEAILRRTAAEGLEKLAGQAQAAEEGRADHVTIMRQILDFQELIFTACALTLMTETKRAIAAPEQPGVKVAVVARGEQLGIQIWTREDGTDARFRPLSDLEGTVLYQHFLKKSERG